MGFTVPNGPDAGTADQAEPDALDYEILGFGPTGVVSGCVVTAQAVPDMSVAVAAGECVVDGVPVSIAGSNVTIQTSDANPRFDIIVASDQGVLSAVRGVASATNPVFPTVDLTSYTVLAAVYVGASTSTIAAAAVVDKRAIVPVSQRRKYGSSTAMVLSSEVSNEVFSVQADGRLSWVESTLRRLAIESMELTGALAIKANTAVSSLLTLTGRAATPENQKVLDVRNSGGTTVASISGTGVLQAANFYAGMGSPLNTVADKGSLYIDLTTPRNRTLWVSEGQGNWEPFRSYDPSDDEVPVGAMMPYLGPTAPVGWLFLDGSDISDTDPETAALAALVGSTYGSAPAGFSALPDFRGRIPIGDGGDVALTLGAVTGSKEQVLTAAQLPPHGHDVTDPGHKHPRAGRPVYAPPSGSFKPSTVPSQTPFSLLVEEDTTNITAKSGVTIGNTGSGDPVPNLPPVIAVKWIAKATATYARISQFSGETLIPVNEAGDTVYMTISEFQTALGI